jgi:hypothetical protein
MPRGIIGRLSGGLFDWISPGKTLERRETKPFKVPPFKSANGSVSANTTPRKRSDAPVAPPAVSPTRTWAKKKARMHISSTCDYENATGLRWESPQKATPSPQSCDISDSIEESPTRSIGAQDGEFDDLNEEGEESDDVKGEADDGSQNEESDGDEIEDGKESDEMADGQDDGTVEDSEVGTYEEDDEVEIKEEEEEEKEEEVFSFANSSFIEDDYHDANNETKVINTDEDQELALKVAEKKRDVNKFRRDLETTIRYQRNEAQKMLAAGWNKDTITLYMLISRRGYEILFPANWVYDFPYFPANIFTSNDDEAYLKQLKEWSGAARKQIDTFTKIGVRVRDSCRSHSTYQRRPEGLIETTLKNYIKWSQKDAGLWRGVRKKQLHPLVVTEAAMTGFKETDKLEEKILIKLRKLAAKHLAALRVENPEPLESPDDESPWFFHGQDAFRIEPPTIYGVVICQTVVALVAYEPLSERDALRTIAFFHYSKPEYDVWNSLALCMMVIYCRDHMMRIQDALPDLEGETTHSDDELA